ncbi:MAG: tandem-95 repeat protein, partial [Pirellulales bacterium]|nr:tandem-95 repeat protein [Pirellulales bacterium]
DGVAVTVDQSVTAADLDAGKLTFTPAADAHGTGYASFDFSVHDGGLASQNTATLTVDVASVNDAPAGLAHTITLAENGTHVFSAADFPFADAEGDALVSVNVRSLPSSGSFTLGGTAVTLNQSLTLAEVNSGTLVFTPQTNQAGDNYAQIGFAVHDGTSPGGEVGWIRIDVTDNLVPRALSHKRTISEDQTHTFSSSHFLFTDVDGGTLSAVRIDSLPAAGSLKLSGVDVQVGQEIAAGVIDTGALTFTPAAHENGFGYTSFGFSVSDGVDFSATPGTLTFHVLAVNDLPVVFANTVTVLEDETYTFSIEDFPSQDADQFSFVTKVKLTSLPLQGSLLIGGVAAAVGDEVSYGALEAGELTFAPAANQHGWAYASFQFQVHDGTGYSSNSETITIDVTSVPEAPSTASVTVVTDEDQNYVFGSGDFEFQDPDNDSLAEVIIRSLPTEGSLQLDSVAVDLNQPISAADIAAGKLQFVPDANEFGLGYARFEFDVSDGLLESALPASVTVDVLAVNDAP